MRDPKLQRSLQDFFPDIDLKDPQVQSWLRDLQVPISVIGQILKTGKQGYGSARSVGIPTLVVQGAEDDLVRPRNTQMLVERLAADGAGGAVRYLEILGGHNIMDRDESRCNGLEQGLIEFSRSIRDTEKKRA